MFDESFYLVAPFVVTFPKAIDIGILDLLVKGGFGIFNSLFGALHESSVPQRLEISTLLCC